MINTGGTEHMTKTAFCDAVAAAKPGDTIVYAIGDVTWATYEARRRGDSVELVALSSVVWEAYTAKQGYLTQRKLPTVVIGHFQKSPCCAYAYRFTKR